MPIVLIGVLAVYQVLLFFVHAAVYQSLAAAFGWHATWLAWFFVVLSLSFVSISILAHYFCNFLINLVYRISAYWFGLIHFLFAAAAGFLFSEYIFYRNDTYIPAALLGAIWFGLAFIIHTYATLNTRIPKMSRVDVSLPHLPEFWHGKKIVFVSDIHLGSVWGEGFAARVAEKIRKESPEMVLIGGDIFDGVKCHSVALTKPFFELKPSQGIYLVSGNHEYIEDTIASFSKIDREGMRILKNEIVEVHGMQIVGVDWKDAKSSGEFETILAGLNIDRKKPSILMRHEPNYLGVAEKAGISLELSGHTHAGQIWPLGYITKKIYKGFDYGMKKLGDMIVYTSSGVGTWGPPLRLGTKAEIVAITLK